MDDVIYDDESYLNTCDHYIVECFHEQLEFIKTIEAGTIEWDHAWQGLFAYKRYAEMKKGYETINP